MKGLVAHPFYRVEKSLPGRRAKARNVYLVTITDNGRAEVKRALLNNLPYMWSPELARLSAIYESLPPDRAEWRIVLSRRVAAVLERFHEYSGVRDEGLPVARILVAQLPELDDIESVALSLSKAEEALYKLQCQLAKLWSDAGLTIEEIRWRNVLAKELREESAKVTGNTGWSGDNFVRGFTMASNRLARSLAKQADKIAVPHHLCGKLDVSY